MLGMSGEGGFHAAEGANARPDRTIFSRPGRAGDAINTVLAAVGYNFRRLLALSIIWMSLAALCRSGPANQAT
jgi:hypothetical protein